jgi:glycosyltransferase involved in cell wall biosynthesis
MRVAYLAPPLQQPDGWRNHACGFIKSISQYVEPFLIVAAADYEIARSLFPEYQLTTLPTIQGAFLRTLNDISSIISSVRSIKRQNYPDVELVHSLEAYPTGLIGYWLAKKLKKPHILTAHGTYSILAYKTLLDRLAYQHVLKNTAVLCPVSHGTANLIRYYFPNAVANICIKPILNGNDYYKVVPYQEVINRKASEIPTILSVGEVKARKGHHIGLQAFVHVKKMAPTARYWIVGSLNDKKYHEELLAFIARHQLKDVNFWGKISEEQLRQCYGEASVFLMPSQQVDFHFEGFGLVYLEAGAFGLPVIGTRTGGIPDAIRDGETGFLVEPDDVEGLANALQRLLTDPHLARQMGLANRQWAETLTWERYAEEQFQVYQEALI